MLLTAAPALAAEVTGYVESRTQYQRSRVHGLIPTDTEPELQQLLEFNTQPRHEYRPGGFVAADLSLFLQGAWRYRGVDADGHEVGVPPQEATAARPFVSLSELYLSHEVMPRAPPARGQEADPLGHRAGPTTPRTSSTHPRTPRTRAPSAWARTWSAWRCRSRSTPSPSWPAPPCSSRRAGCRARSSSIPSGTGGTRSSTTMVAAHAYALVANADLNLMLFQSNLYGDAFEDKTRLGFSFSRYFFDDYELHLEALLQRGSARNYPTPGCLDDVAAAVGCVLANEPLISQRRLDEKRLRPQVLVGTRYQFSDESLLSVEYLYQADGLKRAEFQDVVNGLSLLSVASDFGLDTSRVLGQLLGGTDGGLPQRFRFVPHLPPLRLPHLPEAEDPR